MCTLRFTLAIESTEKTVCYVDSSSDLKLWYPGDKCTHAIYSFIGLNDKTWRYQFTSGNDIRFSRQLREFLMLRDKFPGIKFLIAIGDISESRDKYSRMAQVKSRRKTFVRSIVEFLKIYQFDGVDMDWEYPGDDWTGRGDIDKHAFLILIEDLKNAFKTISRPLEISAAVSHDDDEGLGIETYY
ncbi:unnamed protein product [Allacma fusca]|uniref:GH18 domain-containing protein n=1 Tax=Allacma fusca TaxID=39272 RepID=A0A8J2KI32_9HEXA|nr:unnamed protein product [Allacma fusca]